MNQFKLIKTSKTVKLLTFVLLSIGFNACQNNNQKQAQTTEAKDSVASLITDTTVITPPKEIQYSLALSANALQMINQSNGSTKEIGFGMPLNQTITTVEKILNLKPTIGINSECGAGPLKMATWDNGLTLLFQEKKEEWLFVGWAANAGKNPALKLTTMAGIGVGSTRKEMESAYVIKVVKSSLGYEFSTKTDDLFGIFDGPDKNAKITNLWSGVSCNFR
ncbi:MAG: hypothetical protein KKE39_10010 [Bacteroidetes bacterium]|nr:hypothetical protein [Bacteroidota bacterium]MBU1372351.1 hypothetical protein [Bacteroidota bacterium]MBU1483375.1 hypothetical protein [Bacteroidota bacterium]MBU1760836.1 hypothetical protein [Bacteroidota bacterium]MBU2267189.1 hypothetical protein [Bacteroidota bacterium]